MTQSERDRLKADIIRDMGLIVNYALDRHMQIVLEANGQMINVFSSRYQDMVGETFKSVQERIDQL